MSVTVEPIAAPPSAPLAPAPRSSGSWIYGPWLDLLVGCGAWSAPLLAVALLMAPAHNHAWAMAFYLLAIVFNYPHFMATIYRAYHTRADFEKYKFVTLHVTVLLVLTGIVMHASPRLFPWLFTLYICWSPWHYSGQNYGLLMMFARRSGAEITAGERRWLRGAFVASYLMLLASFETGGSADPLILSLGLPSKFTLPLRLAFGAAFMIFTFLGFRRLIRAQGARSSGRAAHSGIHAIPLVRAAYAAGIEFHLAGAADPLQQRDPRSPTFGAVHLDHQLLPAPRSARRGAEQIGTSPPISPRSSPAASRSSSPARGW